MGALLMMETDHTRNAKKSEDSYSELRASQEQPIENQFVCFKAIILIIEMIIFTLK